MIIPIGDENPTSTTPYVTWTLIGLNVLVFLWMSGQGLDEGNWAIEHLALWPNRVQPHAFLTANFLHGGLMHLGSNMLFLWIAGDNVEERLGHWWYAVVYLGCGAAAMLAHLLIHLGAPIPVVGASGSIAGVLGMYLVFFPNAQIKLLYWFFFVGVWYVSAKWAIGVWFAINVVSALLAQGSTGGGVAYFAHVGGFVAGLAVAYFVKTKIEQGTPPPRRARAPRRAPVPSPGRTPDGIDAQGRPFYSDPQPSAAAGGWQRGPAGSWVVLAASDAALHDPRALERHVAGATGRGVPDVAQSLRAERGFLARGLEQAQARALVQSLNRAGVASLARDESSLRALPPLAEVYRALFSRDGVEADSSTGMLRFQFGDLALAVVGRVRRSGSNLRPNYAFVMTLFLRNGPRLLFVEHDTVGKVARGAGMASGLPLRGQAVWVLNHAPAAARNGGIESLAGGGRQVDWEPYTFEGFAAYEAYTAWLWQVQAG